MQKLANVEKNLQKKVEEQELESRRKYDDAIRTIDDAQEAKIQAMQGTYKLWAVVIPPILLLFVAARCSSTAAARSAKASPASGCGRG